MELICIHENGLHLVFEKTANGQIKLLHFSALPFVEANILHVKGNPFDSQDSGGNSPLIPKTDRYNLVEIMISGQDRPGERHGNKYISTSPGDRLLLKDFIDYKNENGRKLEIVMTDQVCGVDVTSHLQFYDGVQTVRSYTTVYNWGTEPQGLEYVSSFALTG
ncbi:MAG: alpha-galactosidase, partial [Oscillospiraceae bacterium]